MGKKPIWNQTFKLDIEDIKEQQWIVFKLWDSEYWGSDDFLA